MLLGALCLEISMNFMQAHRNNDVKLAGSPRRSKTSECKVEMKIGVVTPSRAAISSRSQGESTCFARSNAAAASY